MTTEQNVLRVSIAVTFALAGLGILFGLLSGSASIVFDGIGLNVTGFSYNGTLWVCVTVCRQMMPDPAVFAQCYRDSFEELLLASKKLKGETPTKAPAKPKATSRVAAQKKAAPAATSAARSQPVAVKPPVQKIAAAKPVVKPTTKKAAKATAGKPASQTASPKPAVSKPATAATNSKTPRRKAPLQPPANRPALKKVERKPADKASAKIKKVPGKTSGKAAKGK